DGHGGGAERHLAVHGPPGGRFVPPGLLAGLADRGVPQQLLEVPAGAAAQLALLGHGDGPFQGLHQDVGAADAPRHPRAQQAAGHGQQLVVEVAEHLLLGGGVAFWQPVNGLGKRSHHAPLSSGQSADEDRRVSANRCITPPAAGRRKIFWGLSQQRGAGLDSSALGADSSMLAQSLGVPMLTAPPIPAERRANCPPLYTALYTAFEKVPPLWRASSRCCRPPPPQDLSLVLARRSVKPRPPLTCISGRTEE